MRPILAALALMLFVPVVMGAGQPPPQRYIAHSDEERAELGRISDYLNSIKELKGAFMQIEPNGDVAQGAIFISKPGKVRFEYQTPNTNLIVCDGSSIYVLNRKLNTRDRYPLAGTPLELILSGNVDLRKNQSIMAVRKEGDSLIVDARSSNKRKKSNIQFVFTGANTELRQWTVIDDQGLSTTVALRDMLPASNLPDSLFVPPDAPKAGK